MIYNPRIVGEAFFQIQMFQTFSFLLLKNSTLTSYITIPYKQIYYIKYTK